MRAARIGVADLRLDGDNPRHDPVGGQRETIQALLTDDGDKLVELAKDIAAHGLSPIDALLVMPNETGSFTVLEGNRRIAALKLLHNPALADGHVLENRFRNLAAKASEPVADTVQCTVAGSRDEARHWLDLRHTGQRGGAGVVEWSAAAKQRFDRRKGSQADRALALIEAAKNAYPGNAALQTDLNTVQKQRLTTLGRLLSDPYMRETFGIEFTDEGVGTHFQPSDLEPALQTVMHDLANQVTVSDLKTKPQRRVYVDQVRAQLPTQAAKFRPDAEPLGPPGAAPKPAPKRQRPKPAAASKKLFGDVELLNLGSKVSAILGELQNLDIDKYPNGAAVLVRAVLELSVGQVHAAKGWPTAQELKNRVKKCLNEIDPGGKDNRYAPVRAGLDDGTSVLAVATLHGYVHNPHYHPTGTELRTIAANYAPFLRALDELV